MLRIRIRNRAKIFMKLVWKIHEGAKGKWFALMKLRHATCEIRIMN